jgi:Ca-activated chloride channel family protein
LSVEADRLLHKRLLGATIVIGSLVATATPVLTQSAAPVFRAGTNVVLLQVTVTGRGGRAIDDLSAEDFTVLEDGVPQQISMVSKAEEPLALSLLLDTSGSMDESIGLAQRAAIQFTERLRSSDIAQVVAFNQNVQVLQPFTSKPAELSGAIRQATVSGTTALYSALETSLRDLGTVRATHGIRRRAIVLLSDGEDTSSKVSLDEVFEMARASDVSIYPIGLGVRTKLDSRTMNQAPSILQKFADATGGRAIFVDRADQLAKVYEQIADELASQYTLAYTSRSGGRDGKWHNISVQVDRTNAAARTRAGYVATP